MNQRTRIRFHYLCLKLADVIKNRSVTFRDVRSDPSVADVVARDMEKEGLNRVEFDSFVKHIETALARLGRRKSEDPRIGDYGRRVPPRPNLDQQERVLDGIALVRSGWPRWAIRRRR